MGLSFLSIPTNVRTPGQYIEFDPSRAVQGLPGQPHKILVIGTRLAAGDVDELVLRRVTSVAQAEADFGRGSMLASMIAALRAANGWTECWAIALDEKSGGVKASGTIAFTGPATAAGTLSLLIGGRLLQVAVAAGDSATTVATAVVAAVTAATDLPVSATNSSGTVTFTAKWKGASGNDIDLRLNYYDGEKLPAGLAAVVTAMASGATDPDLADVIATIGDLQFNTLVNPFTDSTNLTALEAELARRWGPMVQAEGVAFSAACDTLGNLSTLGAARNSQHSVIVGGGLSPTPPWIWAAVVAGVDAAESDPARPRTTLELPGLLPAKDVEQFTRAERNTLLGTGIATHLVSASGAVAVERLITTYQETGAGVPDTAYLDLTTMRTLAYLRYSARARIALRYPRHKLADDGTRFGPGQAVVTPRDIRAELLTLFMEWEGAGLVEGFTQFKDELVVQRSVTDPNTLEALLPPDLINQFLNFHGQIQFLL